MSVAASGRNLSKFWKRTFTTGTVLPSIRNRNDVLPHCAAPL